MKTRMTLLALLLIASTSIYAKNNHAEEAKPAEVTVAATTLSGVVMDKATGEPLTGVEVGIDGTGLKAYTDFDGKYKFESLIPGEYSVSASLIAYQSNGTYSIKVNGNDFASLNLELETIKR